MRLFGAMPMTPENMAAAAKFLHSEQEEDRAAQQRKETAAMIMKQAGQNDYDVYPGMGSKGDMTLRTGPKPRPPKAPKPSRFEEYVSVKEGALGRPLTEDERLQAWEEAKGSSLGKDIAEGFTKQAFNLEAQRLNRAMGKTRETVDGMLMLKVPRKYQGYAQNIKTWQALKQDPSAMAEIDEKTHGQIEFLLDKYEDLAREQGEFYRGAGAGKSEKVTMPHEQRGAKPRARPGRDVRAAVQNDLREWGFK
jgi:hypothetical protein